MDWTANIFLWTSRFTTLLSQCRAANVSCVVKNGVLENLPIFTGKQISESQASGFSRNPGAGVFLWILQNFKNTFFYFLWQIPVSFLGYGKRMLYSGQPTVLFTRRHLNKMFLTLLTEILMISISSRIFSKKHTIS